LYKVVVEYGGGPFDEWVFHTYEDAQDFAMSFGESHLTVSLWRTHRGSNIWILLDEIEL
jgi:hypothetical protein